MTDADATFFSDRQLSKRYGVHPKTIWAWVRHKEFPRPVKLTSGCTRWRSTDVETWEAERAEGAAG